MTKSTIQYKFQNDHFFELLLSEPQRTTFSAAFSSKKVKKAFDEKTQKKKI